MSEARAIEWNAVVHMPRVRILSTSVQPRTARWASVTFLEPDGDGVNHCTVLSKGPGEGLETFLRRVLERWSATRLPWNRSQERMGGYTLALEGDPEHRFIRRFASGAYLVRLSARELSELGVASPRTSHGPSPRPSPPPEWSEDEIDEGEV